MDQQLLDALKSEYQALLEQGRLGDALPLIRQAAHWADVDSQILAERIYLHELYGHPKKDTAGYEYARLAAMNEDVQSMYDLAKLYLEGQGIEHDSEKALYWLNKAAAAGNLEAMDALGMQYLQARGVERDLAKAQEYFEKAAAGGLKPAEKHLQMAKLAAAREA